MPRMAASTSADRYGRERITTVGSSAAGVGCDDDPSAGGGLGASWELGINRPI